MAAAFGYTAVAVIACLVALACCLFLRGERADRGRDMNRDWWHDGR